MVTIDKWVFYGQKNNFGFLICHLDTATIKADNEGNNKKVWLSQKYKS
jgi:hypothetical protein